MDDDKKKKRNKKKKNKQAKTTEYVAVGADENQVSNGHDSHSQVSEMAEIQNAPLDLNRHQSNGAEGVIPADAEKQQLLQRESILKEAVKHLQDEKDSHIQKEATLEDTIKQLQTENDLHIKQVAALEESINELQNEIGEHIKNETALEMDVLELQRGKDFWLQQKTQLEEKINMLLDENARMKSREGSLEEKAKLLEKEKDYWIQMENISKERIVKLNDDITGLRVQVAGLEESRSNLLLENRQLMENVSSLQLRLQNLETSASAHSSDGLMKHASEQEQLNSEIEAARTLVEKLVTENAELVEKVNELFVALESQQVPTGVSSATGKAEAVETPESNQNQNMPLSSHKLESSDEVPVTEERIGVNGHAGPASLLTYSLEADDPGEIVQIPLDDNEVHDLESQVAETNTKDDVPLTDAPLIGAPFRLISFVTKYVSGADLVTDNSS